MSLIDNYIHCCVKDQHLKNITSSYNHLNEEANVNEKDM